MARPPRREGGVRGSFVQLSLEFSLARFPRGTEREVRGIGLARRFVALVALDLVDHLQRHHEVVTFQVHRVLEHCERVGARGGLGPDRLAYIALHLLAAYRAPVTSHT